jgi:voltage-gated potassium channel
VPALRSWLEEAFLVERSPRFIRVQRFVMFWIFLSVATMVLETVPSVSARHQQWFDLIEHIVLVVFTAEYVINVWVAPDRPRYVFGVWGIIDLLAVLPSLILALNVGSAEFLGVMRVMRVLRILRVLKLAKVAAQRFHEREARGAARMDIQIYLIAFFCALTIWSTLAYYAERGQPQTQFTSIPEAMWWGVSTLTGATYGDIYPTTPWGRAVAVCTALSGLALFGLLMNVIGEALHVSLFGAVRTRAAGAAAAVPPGEACPHCGAGAGDARPAAGPPLPAQI